jgi:hypothetical protein
MCRAGGLRRPYDGSVRLAGEHLYEDKTSLKIEEIDPSLATTPERVRAIHREQLAALEGGSGRVMGLAG